MKIKTKIIKYLYPNIFDLKSFNKEFTFMFTSRRIILIYIIVFTENLA